MSTSSVHPASVALLGRYLVILGRQAGLEMPAPDGTSNSHLRWMCQTAIDDSHAWPADKLSRWLGFVQGVMCARGLVTVEGERDLSRPMFHAVYRAAGIVPPSVQPTADTSNDPSSLAEAVAVVAESM